VRSARLSAVALAALSLACASGGGARPDWVDGPASAWPEAAWVTAVATGRDADSASANARAELSRIFHSRVESTLRDVTEFSNPGDGGATTLIEKLAIDTTVSTEGSFEGVRIGDTWEERAATWHAVAVLEKAAMRRSLEAPLADSATRVQGHQARADSAATALGRAKALIDAVRASRERDGLVARARVVGRPPDAFRPSTGDLERDLDAVLAGTRFAVRALEVDPATGDVSGALPALREQLEERITRIGFQVASEGRSDANVWLTCRMSLQEVPRGFEGHFFRWEGAYELTGAPPHGPVVLASQASGGESYATRSVARSRALAKGAEKLAGDLEGQISRYLRERADH
jgi:hypothetical protein